MLKPPHYFEKIREDTSRRWEKLEADPILAAPWYQLFKQVQSPRHVISELLQNADDAGASEASVDIIDGSLVFAHDGNDFTEEHFASLCRFGYSNKRALHTIGFRGVGFKSTFSIGNPVELTTPTLSVNFDRARFTEPIWVTNGTVDRDGKTRVRVPVSSPQTLEELEKNIGEWRSSPISLLFFRKLRSLKIADAVLTWKVVGDGPVDRSEWLNLESSPDDVFLRVTSQPEPFPEDAIEEIREERLLAAGQEADLPPSTIEIVVGAPGRLFVVLPTGVMTGLPFACNAPFVQDPARREIKEPYASPTNRWLLERAGRLAAEALFKWVGKKELEIGKRARAYSLLLRARSDDTGPGAECEDAVRRAFERTIKDKPIVLTDGGNVVEQKEAVLYQDELFDVWDSGVVRKYFDEIGRPPLCKAVSVEDRAKLRSWDLIDEVDEHSVLRMLRDRRPPKPDGWKQLARLWSYLLRDISNYPWRSDAAKLNIVPIRARDVLFRAEDVVRIGEKRLVQSEADWEFLAKYLLVLDHNWPPYLVEQRRLSGNVGGLAGTAENSLTVLKLIGLDNSSDLNQVIEQVALKFFGPEIKLSEAVRFTQIVAKLGVSITQSFKFATLDGKFKSSPVFVDPDGLLEELFSREWCLKNILHSHYTAAFTSCSADEWTSWVTGTRTGISGFPGLVQRRIPITGKEKFQEELQRRGHSGSFDLRYKTENFFIEDWDFEPSYWVRWKDLSRTRSSVWPRMIARILQQSRSYWEQARAAKAHQVSTSGTSTQIVNSPLIPGWVLKFREVACLPDTRGIPRRPQDLLRLTAETRSLLDVEAFVADEIDTESNRAFLDLLGVQRSPTGPTGVLDRLRALSKAPNPPVHEVDKWYSRLDGLLPSISTEDVEMLANAFREEKLIFTEGGEWTTSSGVYLNTDESDVPGADLIRRTVASYRLWTLIGVADRPSADLVIEWVKGLTEGSTLSPGELKRVRGILPRYPKRVWEECGRWLNLAGELVSVGNLYYAMSMQSLIKWGHLHDWVKSQTADLQGLAFDVISDAPFNSLAHLSDRIKNQLHESGGTGVETSSPEWLNRLGMQLRRVRFDDEIETMRVRALGLRLELTKWAETTKLKILPYIDDKPAGMPTTIESVWLDKTLYVEKRPVAKLIRDVSHELGRTFRRDDVTDAIKLCFDRPTKFVDDYMEANFTLAPIEILGSAVPTEDLDERSEPDVEKRVNEPDDMESFESESDPDAGTDESDMPEHKQDIDVGLDPDEDKDDDEETAPRKRTRRPTVMDRFAASRGFRKDGEDRYRHPDGSALIKTPEKGFSWEHRGPARDLLRYYCPIDHCLQHAALQLDAASWDLLSKYPKQYSLVLLSVEGEPVEISGYKLGEMSSGGRIRLYPAAYRIVYQG